MDHCHVANFACLNPPGIRSGAGIATDLPKRTSWKCPMCAQPTCNHCRSKYGGVLYCDHCADDLRKRETERIQRKEVV